MTELKPVALKEWAVAIQALENGSQLILLRKGGIIEETRDFRLESKTFFLYPTYEHQKKDLLKKEYQPGFEEIVTAWDKKAETVAITSYADAVMDLEIFDQDELDLLFPFHIWTEYFAEERLKWKKLEPLHVLILRVYKLAEPLVIPVLPEYNGCKSWIQLQLDGSEAALTPNIKGNPVLTDEQFDEIVTEIRQAIAE